MSFSIRHLRSTRSCQGRHASSPDGAHELKNTICFVKDDSLKFLVKLQISPCCAGLDNFRSITFCLLSHGACYPSFQSTPTAGPWYKLSLSYSVLNNGFDGTFLLNQKLQRTAVVSNKWLTLTFWLRNTKSVTFFFFFCHWGCSDEGLLYTAHWTDNNKALLHFLIALGNILNGTNAILLENRKCSLPRVT